MTKRFFLAALAAVAFISVNAQQTDYPRSEWTKASTILMHTPGIELFDGVIHPTAGLFEHYFDVDKAADEHENYISMLENNGIEVFTVLDVLAEMDMDKLRELASQVLVYDLTDVAEADREANGEAYRQETLSKMTRGDLIRILLLQPTVTMHSIDNNTGIEATYTHQSLMNLYFTRDQSITTPAGHIICNMNSQQRAPETRIIKACYEHMGVKPVYEVTGEGRLEGGDYIPAGNVAFIGIGMRTNQEAIQQMMDADVFGHDTVIVVQDHLLWQMEMHLDTHFNIIDHDLCTMPASRLNAKAGEKEFCTADIWTRKPGTKEYTLQSKDLDFVQLMKDRGYTIIPINRDDELHYANNYLTIAPRHIMAVAGQSQEYQDALEANGVNVEWIPLESLIDGFGAAHCMTQVMKREVESTPTNIKSVKNSASNTSSYTLNGVKIEHTRFVNGVIIKDGKKVLY